MKSGKSKTAQKVFFSEKKQSSIEFKVKYPNFDISAYAVKDVVISTPTDIILKVFPEESVPSAEYKLIYTNTGSGKLEVGGSVLNTGGEITISEGDNTLQFTPTNLGSNSLYFEVNDNFGNKKKCNNNYYGCTQ